jgi:hypothetical protein
VLVKFTLLHLPTLVAPVSWKVISFVVRLYTTTLPFVSTTASEAWYKLKSQHCTLPAICWCARNKHTVH